MELHRRLFVFINYRLQEKSEYATWKNELALRCLSADRVQQWSHLASGSPDSCSAAPASGHLSFRQLVELQPYAWGSALSGLTKRGDRKPV